MAMGGLLTRSAFSSAGLGRELTKGAGSFLQVVYTPDVQLDSLAGAFNER